MKTAKQPDRNTHQQSPDTTDHGTGTSMPTLTLDDTREPLKGLAALRPAPASTHSPYQLHDDLDGAADYASLFTVENQALLFAAFRPQFRDVEFPHPVPIMTHGERQRLLLRRTFTLSTLQQRQGQATGDAGRQIDLLYRRHTLLKLTVYFGARQTLLYTRSAPFVLYPWMLLHPCFDLIERYLNQHHRITDCLASYTHQDSPVTREFWYARHYRQDPLIPARLSKSIRRS